MVTTNTFLSWKLWIVLVFKLLHFMHVRIYTYIISKNLHTPFSLFFSSSWLLLLLFLFFRKWVYFIKLENISIIGVFQWVCVVQFASNLYMVFCWMHTEKDIENLFIQYGEWYDVMSVVDGRVDDLFLFMHTIILPSFNFCENEKPKPKKNIISFRNLKRENMDGVCVSVFCIFPSFSHFLHYIYVFFLLFFYWCWNAVLLYNNILRIKHTLHNHFICFYSNV